MNTNQYKELPKEEINTLTEPKAKPTHDQLHEALMGIQDLLERSTIEFVLLGDIAKAIAYGELPRFDMDKIHIGITRPHYHQSGVSMFHTLLDQEHVKYLEDSNHLFLDYKGTPVEIDIIDNYYSFFLYPDTRNYTITEFRVPNPMSAYLERMNDVK